MKKVKDPDRNSDDILFFIKTRKLFITVCAILVGLTVIVAVVFNIFHSSLIKDYEAVLTEYNDKKEVLHQQNLKHLSGIMNKEFNDDELTNIAKNFCNYSLLVNNQPIKKIDFFYSQSSTITITINQSIDSKVAYYIPDDVAKHAYIENVNEYFQFVTNSKSEPKITHSTTAEGYRTDITYTNINVGENINLLAKREIADKMGLNQGSIEIIYNKEAKQDDK